MSTWIDLHCENDIRLNLGTGTPAELEDLHSTLVFLGKQMIPARVIDSLWAVEKQFLPIIVPVNGFDLFGPNNNTLVQRLRKTDRLITFRHEIVLTLAANGIKIDRTYDFNPHITLQYNYTGSMFGMIPAQKEITFNKMNIHIQQ